MYPWGKTLISSIVLCLLTGIVLSMITISFFQGWQESMLLDNQLQKYRSRLSNPEHLQKEVDSLQAVLAIGQEHIQPEMDLSAELTVLHHAAGRESEIKVIAIQPSSPYAQESLTIRPYRLSLEGPYGAIVRIINYLETNLPNITVDELDFRQKQEQPLRCDLKICFIYLTNPDYTGL